MGLISRKSLRELYTVTVGTILDRTALLGGIAPGLVQLIPTVTNPSEQRWVDLVELQRAGTLLDGTTPLEIWVETAAMLLGPLRQEGVVVRSILRRLKKNT